VDEQPFCGSPLLHGKKSHRDGTGVRKIQIGIMGAHKPLELPQGL
jgi:hypothetical protein